MGAVKALGPEDYSLVGSQGVALTIFKLRKMGIIAEEVGDAGLPFDIIAYPYGRPIRIQVKSTQNGDKRGYMRFRLARGKYHQDKIPYTLNDTDLIALCALHLECVVFRSCLDLPDQITVSKVKMEADVTAGDSFELACQEVWKHQGVFRKVKKGVP